MSDIVTCIAGIIYVLDASDRNGLEEAREELKYLNRENDLKNACLLVYANKQVRVAYITSKSSNS